jgi:uncharacterized protein YkwD
MNMHSQGTRVPTAQGGRRGAWRRVLVTLLVTVGLIAGSAAIAPAASAATRAMNARSAAFDAQMIGYLNQARIVRGLPALREASGLTIMSAWWSQQMDDGKTGGQLKHNPNAWTQVTTYGAANRRAWGENVGSWSGSVSAKALFDAYMASPSHRANILNPKYRFVGMGTVGNFNTMEFTDQVEARTILRATPMAPTKTAIRAAA